METAVADGINAKKVDTLVASADGGRLEAQLKELHLPTVRACYVDMARQARQESLSYEHFYRSFWNVNVRFVRDTVLSGACGSLACR